MKKALAEVLREYGPFDEIEAVHGVTYDGTFIWFASGDRLNALDPESGKIVRTIDGAADAGTACDGRHLFQIAGSVIRKLDLVSGASLGSIPLPGSGPHSGLAWADGLLWVGAYHARKIYQVDPDTGAVLRTLESDRFVTGVTWVAGELWHGTSGGDASALRRLDPGSGAVLECLELPAGTDVSGVEWDGGDRFFCGAEGSPSKVRVIRRSGS